MSSRGGRDTRACERFYQARKVGDTAARTCRRRRETRFPHARPVNRFEREREREGAASR